MNHRSAEFNDTLERGLDVRYLEVGKRPAVALARPALMQALSKPSASGHATEFCVPTRGLTGLARTMEDASATGRGRG
jgi:hypothetical protein